MEFLEGKQLIVVAGKGGVGKTTTSSALAMHLAKQGKRTLLVTVDPAKRLEDSLGIKIGFQERPIQPNLTAMMLDPAAVITEHLEREVPQAKVTDHPLFRYVTNYMPGLNELMAIGKLNDFRRQGNYDVIVVDTAPTGHALSFLSAPGAIRELMSEKSLIRWAIRGYQVWQKLQSTANKATNLFRKKEDHKGGLPEIDFESIFEDIRDEAGRIQSFLTDPETSAFLVVTLPEKMPVEETIDLHTITTQELGMKLQAVIVNKLQPDPFEATGQVFEDPTPEEVAAVEKALRKQGRPEGYGQAVLDAAIFGRVRREMNLQYVQVLRERLPDVPLLTVPLFKHDVHGLGRLETYRKALVDPANHGSNLVEATTS